MALLLSPASAAPDAKEYELKAAFLYNFTKFVTWPAASFQDATSPIVIGVYGKSPFGPQLAAAIRARKVDGRTLELRSIATIDEAKQAHLIFFPASVDVSAREALPGLQRCAILTVGETPEFQSERGVITFMVEDGKLRFVIDMAAAQNAGLKISAQLQKLAHHVRRTP